LLIHQCLSRGRGPVDPAEPQNPLFNLQYMVVSEHIAERRFDQPEEPTHSGPKGEGYCVSRGTGATYRAAGATLPRWRAISLVPYRTDGSF
jgi:hypothetical protein